MNKLEFYIIITVLIGLVLAGFVFVGLVDKFSQELIITMVGG